MVLNSRGTKTHVVVAHVCLLQGRSSLRVETNHHCYRHTCPRVQDHALSARLKSYITVSQTYSLASPHI